MVSLGVRLEMVSLGIRLEMVSLEYYVRDG